MCRNCRCRSGSAAQPFCGKYFGASILDPGGVRGFVMLCMRDHDDWIDLYWKNGILRSKPGATGRPPPFLEIANEVGRQVAATLGGRMAQDWFAVAGKATSSHFIGGMTMGRRHRRQSWIRSSECSGTLACTSWTEASSRRTRA
jgi:hypothetical protein